MKSPATHPRRQPAGLRAWVVAAVVLPALGGLGLSSADDKAEKAPAKAAETGQPAPGAQPPASALPGEVPVADAGALSNSGLKAFGDMIPLGTRSRGAVIPAFEDGKPSTLITADALTRVDASRLFAEKLVIRLFAEARDQDVRVDMKTGTYNMDEQLLSSTERSRVSRSDFQIEGDGMVFDTRTSQGKMVGNVEMIIHDVKATAAKMNMTQEKEEKPTADAQPKAPDAKTDPTQKQ